MNKIQTEIDNLKFQFRILDEWEINYCPDVQVKGACSWDIDSKQAKLFKFRKGSGRIPQTYILHEMIHIALAEVMQGKSEEEEKKEEHIVRAICGLIDNKKLDKFRI